jgi:3-oxoacyl-[acyl-carrier protein] reductase
VFGGSRGIGAACVDALARDGFEVAFTYVAQPEAARVRERAPRVKAYRVDVCDAAAVAQTFTDVERDFGKRVHAVVANAGINLPPHSVASFPAAEFRRLVDVNLVGAFNVLGEAARRVQDGGSIVALSTSFVRHAVPGFGPYIATKAGVESLVRSMAKELAARQVRVNAVAPGPVDTDLFHSGKTEEVKRRSAALSPLDRIGRPDEVAALVGFLVGDAASWIDGQVVQPNGGLI